MSRMIDEKMVQNAIFDWLITHKYLALRINSGAMVFKDNEKRRFVRFAFWQVLGQVMRSAGVSDILACARGKFVAIEVKAPGKKSEVTENQADFLAAVKKNGGLALVADCIEDVEAVLGRDIHEN